MFTMLKLFGTNKENWISLEDNLIKEKKSEKIEKIIDNESSNYIQNERYFLFGFLSFLGLGGYLATRGNNKSLDKKNIEIKKDGIEKKIDKDLNMTKSTLCDSKSDNEKKDQINKLSNIPTNNNYDPDYDWTYKQFFPEGSKAYGFCDFIAKKLIPIYEE